MPFEAPVTIATLPDNFCSAFIVVLLPSIRQRPVLEMANHVPQRSSARKQRSSNNLSIPAERRRKRGEKNFRRSIGATPRYRRLLGTGDTQILHARLERRPLHPEPRRGAGRSADQPFCFRQRAENMFALGGFERRRG